MVARKTQETKNTKNKSENKNEPLEKRLSIFSPQSTKIGEQNNLLDETSKSVDQERAEKAAVATELQQVTVDLLNSALETQFIKIKNEIQRFTEEFKNDLNNINGKVNENSEKMKKMELGSTQMQNDINILKTKIVQMEQKHADLE
ncbi:Hypothetical predicted protein [Pelobates cultripes]|uniref:Uncharacterized protein n=1 Tax=Pelobates cultripes TaxID=61616 RepID=A0AAD1VMH4_PELCU|nr:Hypothetical predicted protein [Pelobates cultripes]